MSSNTTSRVLTTLGHPTKTPLLLTTYFVTFSAFTNSFWAIALYSINKLNKSGKNKIIFFSAQIQVRKQTDTIRNLRGHWFALPREQRSIETTVDMVKHSSSAPDQGVGFVATCKPYKKDHWKGNSWYKKDYTRSNKKCYRCGNYGHEVKYCDDNKSIKKVQEKCPLIFPNAISRSSDLTRTPLVIHAIARCRESVE